MHYRRETLILFIDFGIFWSSSPAVFCSQFLLQLAEYSVAQSSLDGLAVQPGTVHILSSQPFRDMLLERDYTRSQTGPANVSSRFCW